MVRARLVVGAVAVVLALLSVWSLERARSGLVIAPLAGTGTIPATVFRLSDAPPAPVVVIAHGFAGSRQLMESFAVTLAQAGYVAVTFDFMGHGRNPAPMSGDVTRIDGTTRLLMEELRAVSDAALALPEADGRLALLGHSMASDIVVRQALADPRTGAVVAVSMFSRAVTETAPDNLLILPGEWEPHLRDEALRALRLADPEATFGQTVGDPAAGNARRAVVAPGVEHVGVLYSGTVLRETRTWLDAAFGRSSDGPVERRGGWIALLLVSVAALGWPLARLLPRSGGPAPMRLPTGRFLLAALLPALAVPLALWPFDPSFLPVLVADYLAVHFAAYGALALAVLWRFGALRSPGTAVVWALPVALFAIAVFGGALDRYVASFWPTGPRWGILAAMALGTIAHMTADAVLTEAGRAPIWRTLAVRGAFLASLGLAVALDFEGLFFLLIILPVILLFYLLFGTMAGWVGRRTGVPAVAGVALGLTLAWSLAVTFPTFVAG